MSNVVEFDPYALNKDAIKEPPTSIWSALRQVGPGIILAGTIVGSGELLLTTRLGAKFGFTFLWLILFSCLIKVFVQIELGRYTISAGKPTLGAINELGGPRLGAHWILWWWLVMILTNICPLGAMTGTVGQCLNLAYPTVSVDVAKALDGISPHLAEMTRQRPEYFWSILVCISVMMLLWTGSYRRIEKITTVLVVGVTLLTVIATIALPATNYPIRWPEVAEGLTFKAPAEGIAIAFGVFGVTGVGAAELFSYPYWCIEKGYARYCGKREADSAWERRAKGWIRVMQFDAWISMVLFTVCTVSFFFMGATVLYPQGLHPEGKDMIQTLSKMFIHSFGDWTRSVFLVGAAAVLYKTLYLGSAGNARLIADFLGLSGAVDYSVPIRRLKCIHYLSISMPVIALALYFSIKEPIWLVVIGGFTQALTIPLITAVTIYFRYKKLDPRLRPSKMQDLCMLIAFVSISTVAVFALRDQYIRLMTPPPA